MEETDILGTRCSTYTGYQSIWLVKIIIVLSNKMQLKRCLGDHPFHISLELNNTAQTDVHGIFLLNSNAMDVDLQPLPALTYTTIGGIIDLYIFTGPTVQNVIEQYWAVIGVTVIDEMIILSTLNCFRNLCCLHIGHLDFIFADTDITASII